MASEVLLPKQGNSVESCIIVEWKVDEGDRVKVGDTIMEVETDKATMDVASSADGVLLKRLVAEGDDVAVLSPVAVVGEPGESVDDDSAPAGDAQPAGRDDRAPQRAADAQTAPPSAPSRRSGRVRISPRARKLAERSDIGYEALTGSGPGGRIMVRDIERAMEAGAGRRDTGGTPPEARATGGVVAARVASETPIKGVRKLIAKRMHESIVSTAQLTMDSSADARSILAYRSRLKGSEVEAHQSVSINDLVLYAVSRVLRDFSALNATFSDGIVRTYDQVDLGFAVDTPRGLMVPVIRGADRRSLVGLATEAHRLAKSCLEGGVTSEELAGGTFTVTNLGAFGIERFTPVLNTPQVAILGVCAVTPRPAPEGEGTVPMMGLSLTIDHQIVDGAPAARFLHALARAVSQIDLTLAE